MNCLWRCCFDTFDHSATEQSLEAFREHKRLQRFLYHGLATLDSRPTADFTLALQALRRLEAKPNDATGLLILDELWKQDTHVFSLILPQVCSVSVSAGAPGRLLFRLLLDKCRDSVQFALELYWHLFALAQPQTQPHVVDVINDLMDKVQTAVVSISHNPPSPLTPPRSTQHHTPHSPDGVSPTHRRANHRRSYSESPTPSLLDTLPSSTTPPASPTARHSLGSVQEMSSGLSGEHDLASLHPWAQDKAHAMQILADVFESQLWLSKELSVIANRVSGIAPPQRKEALAHHLRLLSAQVQDFGAASPAGGLIAPLSITTHPATLLAIDAESCAVFATKTRCPLLVVFEVETVSDTQHDSEEDVPASPTSGHRRGSRFPRHNDLSRTVSSSLKGLRLRINHLKRSTTATPKGLRLTRPKAAQAPAYMRHRSSTTEASPSAVELRDRGHSTELLLDSSMGHAEESTRMSRTGALGEIGKGNSGLVEEVFGRKWVEKREIIRQRSPVAAQCRHTWGVHAMIVKVDDDLRQEHLAFQLLLLCKRWLDGAGVPVFLYPYRIVVTGPSTGLVEFVPDSASLDSVKKKLGDMPLAQFFNRAYGPPGSAEFRRAQTNFIASLAAYSIVSHILNIKDRHNGNILLLRTGHIAHIDFGFMLGNSPGGTFKPSGGWELSPFKLTREYVELMGGRRSPQFATFCQLCVETFQVLHSHARELLVLVRGLYYGEGRHLPCFAAHNTLEQLEQRLLVGVRSRNQITDHVHSLITQSANAWSTTTYDQFQLLTNNIRK